MVAHTSQEVRARVAPVKAKSPLKKVKRDRSILKAMLAASVKKQRHQIFELKADGLRDEEMSF